MEETQLRINKTLENLLQLRQCQSRRQQPNDVNISKTQPPAARTVGELGSWRSRSQNITLADNKTSVKRDSFTTRECDKKESSRLGNGPASLPRTETDFLHETSQNILNGNISSKRFSDNGEVINNNFHAMSNNRNDNSGRNSYQFPIESPVKNKIQGLINSVKILKNRNSVEKEVVDKNIIPREKKNPRTKETFSVEDFTELIRSLPANHLTEAECDLHNVTKSETSKSQQFYVAKELCTSERDYVASLKLICEDFRNFMIGSSQDVPQSRINNFNNLPEIYNLSRDLSQEFEYRIKFWDEHRKISDIFLHYRSHFNIYLPYLQNFSLMNKHFDECCSNNSQFRNVCINFEKLPKCRNLKVKHFLLKPVQRFPQYKLLLTDYLKHLTKDAEDYEDTVKALEIVTDLLKNANDVILWYYLSENKNCQIHLIFCDLCWLCKDFIFFWFITAGCRNAAFLDWIPDLWRLTHKWEMQSHWVGVLHCPTLNLTHFDRNAGREVTIIDILWRCIIIMFSSLLASLVTMTRLSTSHHKRWMMFDACMYEISNVCVMQNWPRAIYPCHQLLKGC